MFKNLKIKRLTKKLKFMQANRVHNPVSDQELSKEKELYHELAGIYQLEIGNKRFPYASVLYAACLRAAAELEDTTALYQLGEKLLEEAKLRMELQEEVLFASSANERQMKYLFEEALVYLQKAEKLGHIKAKRLHGLCYINGWGLPIDKDKGFDLIVESIEQENSWDKVPQIFAEIGLNKPEFFSAIMKHRAKGS